MKKKGERRWGIDVDFKFQGWSFLEFGACARTCLPEGCDLCPASQPDELPAISTCSHRNVALSLLISGDDPYAATLKPALRLMAG